MAKGTPALVGLLGLASAALVLVIGSLAWFLAPVAEVFAALFDPEGAEIHLKPAPHYLHPGTPANFATVIEAAGRRGETAIGYRLQADVRQAPSYGVSLNPDKSAPQTLGVDDQVIVLADTWRRPVQVATPT